MHNSTWIRMSATLRLHVRDWDAIPPHVRQDLLEFVLKDRVRERNRVFQELGRVPAPPDDNPVPGGSPT